MRKTLTIFIIIVVLLFNFVSAYADTAYYYDNAWHSYKGNIFKLKVNGKILDTEMPPIVFNDYSVVPARDVFSALGALVEWDEASRQVYISTDSVTITLKINSLTAKIGNESHKMVIPPKIINGKTMIPVRFVGETLGYDVSFDSANDTVCISEKADVNKVDTNKDGAIALRIEKTEFSQNSDSIVLKISTNGTPKYNSFMLSAPSRLVVDTEGEGFVKKPENITVLSSDVSAIRFGQNESGGRTVFDLKNSSVKYDITVSGNDIIITVYTKKSSAPAATQKPSPTAAPSANPTAAPNAVPKPETDPLSLVTITTSGGRDTVSSKQALGTAKKLTSPDRIEFEITGTNLPQKSAEKNISGNFVKKMSYSPAGASKAKIVLTMKDGAFRMTQTSGKITVQAEKAEGKRSIMIDPGHGGADAGAVGYAKDGKPEAYEKDFNLDVALRLSKILKQKNVDVKMIRTTDTYVDFQQVGSIANDAGVDLFVSIHTNSSSFDGPTGIETWAYLEENATIVNGMSGKRFAEIVQNELIYATKAYDRGVKNGKSLAVIRSTSMPAILVEMGFISTESERHKLMTESYRQTIAEAIASGVMLAFKEMGI